MESFRKWTEVAGAVSFAMSISLSRCSAVAHFVGFRPAALAGNCNAIN